MGVGNFERYGLCSAPLAAYIANRGSLPLISVCSGTKVLPSRRHLRTGDLKFPLLAIYAAKGDTIQCITFEIAICTLIL